MGYFLPNLYEIEVMITSLMKVLDLPNFGNITTSTTSLESSDDVLLMMS